MGLVAIGDIHGCGATMEALLEELAPTTADHLVFIGDYVDRGPDSRGVLDRLVRLSADAAAGRGPACTFLRGNHDQMMLDYIDSRGANLPLWRMNGGLSTIAAYVDAAGRGAVPNAAGDGLLVDYLLGISFTGVAVHVVMTAPSSVSVS